LLAHTGFDVIVGIWLADWLLRRQRVRLGGPYSAGLT
jgi:hypothetical protein